MEKQNYTQRLQRTLTSTVWCCSRTPSLQNVLKTSEITKNTNTPFQRNAQVFFFWLLFLTVTRVLAKIATQGCSCSIVIYKISSQYLLHVRLNPVSNVGNSHRNTSRRYQHCTLGIKSGSNFRTVTTEDDTVNVYLEQNLEILLTKFLHRAQQRILVESKTVAK